MTPTGVLRLIRSTATDAATHANGNRAAEVIVGPYSGLDGGRPNVIESLLCDPAQRQLFVEWEHVAQGALATSRADCAAHVGNPDFQNLVERLTHTSVEFAAWWPRHDVAQRLSGAKRLFHPDVGEMRFAFSMLAVGDKPGMKAFVFTPVDEENTPRKLRQLLEGADVEDEA